MPLALNPGSAIVNYSNRTVKSVIHDLLVKYGKTEIEYIIDQCVSEIEGDAQDKLLEFVRNIRDGKFHGHGFEHPDEPCNCNELAAADYLQIWRGLTPRVPDVATCLCGGEYYTDKVLGVVCCRCQAPRR